ncbi:MAG: TonB family protein [Sandaracinus sp.]
MSFSRALPFALVLALAARVAAQPQPPTPQLTRAPDLVRFVEAPYPEAERERGADAAVLLEITIDETGHVREASVTESGGEAFDAAALEAVRAFEFTPAEIDGAPSAIRIAYRYTFHLAVEESPVAPSSLRGIVRARGDGHPLAGITLEARAETESEPHVTTSDAEGHFVLEGLPAGTIALTLRGEAIPEVQTSETLGEGETLEVAYDLTLPAPAEPGESGDDLEIVVVAPPLRRTAVSTEVRADEARVVPGTSGDVLRVVESLPGVARSAAGAGQLVVWGASPEDTRVYVDGVRVPRLYHEGGLRSVVHSGLVRSIELVPGGYGASYGRGLGGLVAVGTELPHEDGVHGQAQVDVLDASALLRGSTGDFSAGIAARVSLVDLYAARLFGSDVSAFVPIPRYRDGQARLRFELGSGEHLDVVGLLGSDQYTRGVPSADPGSVVNDRRALDFQRLYLRYVREPGDGSSLVVTPFVGLDQSSRTTQVGSLATSLGTSVFLAGLRASYRVHAVDWLDVEAGLDAEVTSTSLARSGSIALPAREGDLRTFGQPIPDTIASDRWDVVQVGLAPYVELDGSFFGGALHVVPSFRVDPYFRSVSRRVPTAADQPGTGLFAQDFRAEPRLSIRGTPAQWIELRGALGLYHQQPSPEDLSSAFGAPTLPVSESLHAVLGTTIRPIETLSIELTGFFTSSSGLAMRSTAAAPLPGQALVPSGSGRSYGLQALVRRELAEGLFGWVAYTLSRAERENHPGEGYRLFDYDQTHVLTAVLSWDVGLGFTLGARFRWATGMPRTPVVGASYDAARDRYAPIFGAQNGMRLPDFVQLDLRVARVFELGDSRLEISLEVLNTWNQPNAEEIVYASDYASSGYVTGFPVLPVLGLRWEI